jgi:hypothetical protein
MNGRRRIVMSYMWWRTMALRRWRILTPTDELDGAVRTGKAVHADEQDGHATASLVGSR